MAYDYQEAFDAGANEDQVLDYLNKTRGYDVQGAIKAGANKRQVIEYLSKTSAGVPEAKDPKSGLSFENFKNNFLKPVGDFALGALKGTTETVQNLGKGAIEVATLGKADTSKFGLTEEQLQAEGTAQEIGKTTERIAEFLAPSTAVVKAQKLVTGALNGGRVVTALARGGVEALSSGTITAAQQGKIDNNVKTAALVSALFPIVGEITKAAGGLAQATGQKIQQSVIKPSVADIKDGFKVENIQKYNLGGSLEKMLTKTNVKMSNLSQDLKEKIQGTNVVLNLNSIFEGAAKKLDGNQAKNFGDIGGIGRALDNLRSEIEFVAGKNGLVDLMDAQMVKRGAGTKGAWVYGSADPDARAVEKVYTSFYRELKSAIEEAVEKSGNGNIKEINRQISDLIPINNALLRRIPVEQRNNALSLTDLITLTGSVLDPSALALTGANRLSKSAAFGDVLTRAGDTLKNPQAKNALLQRFFGSSKPVIGVNKP